MQSAVACRLSVRPSVTLVGCDQIGWNSSKIISRIVSVGRSLSADPNMDLLQGKQPEIWAQSDAPHVDLSVGDANCGRMGRVFRVGRSSGAISGYMKSKMAAGRHLEKFRMAVSA